MLCSDNNGDKRMLEGLRSKNQNGLSEFIDAYSRYVYAIVKRICAGYAQTEDIEECVSDVLFMVWKNAENIDLEKGSLKAYTGAVGRNRAFDLLEALKKSADNLPLDDNLLSPYGDPLDELIGNEAEEALLNALMVLKEPDDKIFIRKYRFGEGTKKIAEKLNMTERAVEGRLYRGREKLRKILKSW